MTGTIDDLLAEYLSYRAFKEGKAPVNGADPGKRIRKRIWRDEGLDVGAFLGTEPGPEVDALLVTEVRKLSMGFLRSKMDRTIAVGIRDPSSIISTASKGGEIVPIVQGSALLMPPFISLISTDLSSAIGLVRIGPVRQEDPSPFAPSAPAGAEQGSRGSEEDVSALLDRKVHSEHQLIIKAGRRITSMRMLVQGIMEMGGQELSELLTSGKLAAFARAGLSSTALESILTEVAVNRQGPEDPSVARERFLLWVLEGPSGLVVVREIVAPMVRRMENCSLLEASRLCDVLSPLMDERSAPALIDALFKADAANRPWIIRLLGRSRSQLAIQPLIRLRDLSSVGSDRTEARSALERLGHRDASI